MLLAHRDLIISHLRSRHSAQPSAGRLASSWIIACVGRNPPGCNIRRLVKRDRAPKATAPIGVGAAHSTTAERRYAFVVRQTRPATPLNTGAVAQSAPFTSRTVTSLAIVFATRPDRCAVITIAISVSALAIFRASSIGYILGPGSGRTVIADCPIERRERSNSRRRAGNLPRTHRGDRRRCSASGIFDMPSPWHRLNR